MCYSAGMSQVFLAYIPVLHQGYLQLFAEFSEVRTVYLLTNEVAQEFTPVHKELRAIEHQTMIKMLESLGRFERVISGDVAALKDLNSQATEIVIPDEVVTNQVAQKYLPDCTVTTSSIFLRWDKDSITKQVSPTPDETISAENFMNSALAEGQKSSDWWRQVGAAAVRDGKIIAQAHNTHLPSEQQPYVEGDARAHFHKGENIELTTAIHAEAKVIAEAAADGLSLNNTELYVTDFPCPTCAKLIAHSGVTKVYYQKGYSVLDGERVLKAKNIELIQVLPPAASQS